MFNSWVRVISTRKLRFLGQISSFTTIPSSQISSKDPRFYITRASSQGRLNHDGFGRSHLGGNKIMVRTAGGFCSKTSEETEDALLNDADYGLDDDVLKALEEFCGDSHGVAITRKSKTKGGSKKSIDFTKVDLNLLPTVIIIGRPNVGKSALFNRLIRRREALVFNTPTDHVTRDIREGIAKLSDLRFRVLDSAGLEAEASSGSVLSRTAGMTGNVLERSQIALFLMDARAGLQPMDLDVGKWLRKRAPGMKTVVVMNKAESLDDGAGSVAAAAGEAHALGFGEPIALSAETGLGLTELYEVLRPLLEEHMLQVLKDEGHRDDKSCGDDESKLPLQLAIVGRPNVGKSTLLNALLQEERVLVGPEVGLTRDSIRAQFQYQGRTIFMVDTAGWLERTKQDKGAPSLSVMQSRKNLMRAHIVALVLDGEEIAKERRTMEHAEVAIARRAVEEGRGLVVVVNKMDLLDEKSCEKVMKAVPEEVQTVIPQVMSRHSWKDEAAQPKIKYFTQVKARPPTFVAFLGGKTKLAETDLRFLTRSLKEDFDIGSISVRIMEEERLKGSCRTRELLMLRHHLFFELEQKKPRRLMCFMTRIHFFLPFLSIFCSLYIEVPLLQSGNLQSLYCTPSS